MKVETIDYSADVDNMLTKIEKLKKLYNGEKMDFNLIRYNPVCQILRIRDSSIGYKQKNMHRKRTCQKIVSNLNSSTGSKSWISSGMEALYQFSP